MTWLIERLGRLGATILLLAVAMALVWWGYSTWASGKSAKVEARLGREQTTAAIESGGDAVNTVGATHAGETASDAITRSNEHDILTAPGADAPVDPAATAAGKRSLCQRAAYRDRPECLQHPPAR